MDDAEAVRLVMAGDRRGAQHLLEKYQMDVYNQSLRIMANAADAEDVTQDAFLAALQRIGSFRPEEPFLPWLRTIARNRAIDVVHRLARTPRLDPPAHESVEDPALERMEAERVRRALDRLADRDRALLVLRYWEDLPVSEVARSLDMTEGAARVALLRARRALAGELAGEVSRVGL